MEEGSSESAGGSEERSESDDSLEPEPEPEREATYTRGGKAALLPDYSYRYAGRSMAYWASRRRPASKSASRAFLLAFRHPRKGVASFGIWAVFQPFSGFFWAF